MVISVDNCAPCSCWSLHLGIPGLGVLCGEQDENSTSSLHMAAYETSSFHGSFTVSQRNQDLGMQLLMLGRMSFLTGVPFTVAVIQIPQEWQTVVRTSTLVAGLRLLPFTLFYSVGQVIAMLLMSKLQVPPVFVFFLGAVSQTIGMAVQAFIPFHAGAGKYGCEILLGVGLGANMGGLVQFTPQLIRGKDQGI